MRSISFSPSGILTLILVFGASCKAVTVKVNSAPPSSGSFRSRRLTSTTSSIDDTDGTRRTDGRPASLKIGL